MHVTAPYALSLTAPAGDELLAACSTFEALAPVLFKTTGVLHHSVLEGWLDATRVDYNNVPAYMLFTHISPDNGCWIDAAQRLIPGLPYPILDAAAIAVAKAKKAKYIRMMTRRKGMVEASLSMGWQVESVCLAKEL